MISRKQLAACIFLASGSLACADWTGWYTNAYPVGSVFRFDQTNAPRADLYAATNTVTYTNDLRFGVSTSITVRFLSNVQVDDWQGPHTITNAWLYPLRRYYTNGLFSNVVYTARVVSTMCRTSLYVQARDVWAIDAYRAAKERTLAVGLPWPILGHTMHTAQLYSHNEQFCREAKECLYYLVNDFDGGYVDATSAAWRVSAPLSITSDYPFISWPDMCAKVPGLPTNWAAITAQRELNGAGVGMGRYATTRWVIVGSSTGTVTNTSVNACGASVTLIGTNGQIITAVCTNLLIEAGRTTLDYGFKYFRAVATNLQVTANKFHAYATGTNWHWKYLAMSPDGIDTSSIPLLCSSIDCEPHEAFTNNALTQVRFKSILSGGYWGAGYNEGSGLTNAAAALDRSVTDFRAWAGTIGTADGATGVLAGAGAPTVWQYYKADLTDLDGIGGTYSGRNGWPVVLTNSPSAWRLAETMSGGAGAFANPTNLGAVAAATLSASALPCGTYLGGYVYDVYDKCSGGGAYGIEVGISGQIFDMTVSPYTFFDWTVSATNGFRYR